MVFYLLCILVMINAVWAGLKLPLLMQGAVTLAASILTFICYLGVQSSGSPEGGAGSALVFVFLVMFPCLLFIAIMWATAGIQGLTRYFRKSPNA